MHELISFAVSKISTFRKSEKGVTAIEYGLIAGAIAVAIIAVLLILGNDINNLFKATAGALQQATGSGGS